MAFTISIVIIAFLSIVQIVIPYLVKRSVVFGVSIPEQFINHKDLMNFKKRYSMVTAAFSLLLIVTFILWVTFNTLSDDHIIILGTIIEFCIILISLSFYFYFHSKTKQLKKSQNWLVNLKQVKVTDLSVRNEDEMLPWYVYLLPMVITVGLLCYTLLKYDSLPDLIPTHWGVNGADAWTEKSLFSAMQLSLVLLVMQLLFLGIHVATKVSGIKLSASNVDSSRRRQLALRKSTSWLLFFIILLMTMLFSFLQITTIHPVMTSAPIMFIVPFAFLLLVLVGTIIFAIKVGRSDKELAEVSGEVTDIDEDKYWKGGIFYFNKQDPSIFVEKRFGVGWTLNLANPLGYLIVVVPLVIILIISFL